MKSPIVKSDQTKRLEALKAKLGRKHWPREFQEALEASRRLDLLEHLNREAPR